jgi:uncharacterized protein (TIGR02996 family)
MASVHTFDNRYVSIRDGIEWRLTEVRREPHLVHSGALGFELYRQSADVVSWHFRGESGPRPDGSWPDYPMNPIKDVAFAAMPFFPTPVLVDLQWNSIDDPRFIQVVRAVSSGPPRPYIPGHPLWSAECAAFIAAVEAAPNDDLPKLVFADWLEENYELITAENVRIAVQDKPVVDELATTRALMEHRRRVTAEVSDALVSARRRALDNFPAYRDKRYQVAIPLNY